MSGQAPPSVKAGAPAPNLTWTKIVNSTPTSAGPQSPFGQTTVLLFLAPVSHNEETLSAWNKLVEEFADKPVNFVWIANEPEESLAPFLKTHPVRGRVALEQQQESSKSYGVEGGGGVLIDPQGTVIGFGPWTPDREQIQAVLDGRAIVIRGEPTEQQKDALFEGRAARLEAEPSREPPAPQKPELHPSEQVPISPTRTEGAISSIEKFRRALEQGLGRAVLDETKLTGIHDFKIPGEAQNTEPFLGMLTPPRRSFEIAVVRPVE